MHHDNTPVSLNSCLANTAEFVSFSMQREFVSICFHAERNGGAKKKHNSTALNSVDQR
jgi:hypothetical protein